MASYPMQKTGLWVGCSLFIVWAAIFFFGPKLRTTATPTPGIHSPPPPIGYLELQTTAFENGLFPDRQTPPTNIDGGLGVFYRKGFLGFDFGTLRVAIRNTTPAFQKYIRDKHSTYPAALIVSPPRIPKTVTYPPSPLPHIEIHEMAEGTRVICDGKTFEFIQGKVTINGKTYSAIGTPPTLLVLDSAHVTEYEGHLPAHLFPPVGRRRAIRR